MSDGIVEHEGGYSLRLSRKSATGYRHVTYNNRTGNYLARIQRAGDDDIQLGSHSSAVAAAIAVAKHLDNLPDGDAIFGSEGLSSAIRFERGMFPSALIVISVIGLIAAVTASLTSPFPFTRHSQAGMCVR